MVILETKKLCKIFGGLTAVWNLNLEVNQGEIVGLIGPNGAGKSTTFNLITGVLKPTNGRVIFKGKDVTGLKPYVIANMGIIRTFQLTSFFHTMSVRDNIRTALHLKRKVSSWGEIFNTPAYRKAERDDEVRISRILDFVGLNGVARDEPAAILPLGFQRLLGVAMALAADPTLLLLDEPMTGMNTKECIEVTNVIRRIRNEKDCTVLLVEHNVQVVLEICDRITVLNYGEQICQGTPNEITKNTKVIEAYLGAEE